MYVYSIRGSRVHVCVLNVGVSGACVCTQYGGLGCMFVYSIWGGCMSVYSIWDSRVHVCVLNMGVSDASLCTQYGGLGCMYVYSIWGSRVHVCVGIRGLEFDFWNSELRAI